MSRRPDKEAEADLQYETEHTEPARPKSVLPYLAILVAAAFVLLFMAYMMQRRTAESVQGLTNSASALQSINQLIDDNRALHEENDRLQLELTRSEGLRESLSRQLYRAQAQLAEAQSQLDQPQDE